MKLNLVKANINTIPDASRVYLSMLKKPFYFAYYKGVLYVNEDIANLDKIIPAIENLWECTTADPTEASSTAADAAYDLIADLQGSAVASQFSSTWHSAATEYSKQKSKEHLSGDPVVSAETAEHGFLEQKQALAHWLHIAQVFQEQKENLHANPMQDIADSFSRYLGVISGGKVFSEFPEGDKLSMDVYSGDALLNYDKLSEGTKETVSLAFRLAVLDHLFTDGGGTIVLDDPFADMDAERAKQACTLIRECAKRHQVIFLTCHEAYADMLQGNAIWM